MKIVITGKTGLLATQLRQLNDSIVSLSKEEYDITNVSIVDKLTELNADVVIHAAAMTDSNLVDKNRALAINTNIIGTANIAKYCLDYDKRLVYISTDYIYDGRSATGNHTESDSVLPQNNYAWTKLGGECSARLVSNHVIIRTSFGQSKFPYEVAWDNLIVSKDYVDVISPKILKVAMSSITGVINIGTRAKSMFEYAGLRNEVNKKSLPVPLNFSLNLDRYEKLFSN
jgi:dTDP-4-dehydrorhamnose reductase